MDYMASLAWFTDATISGIGSINFSNAEPSDAELVAFIQNELQEFGAPLSSLAVSVPVPISKAVTHSSAATTLMIKSRLTSSTGGPANRNTMIMHKHTRCIRPFVMVQSNTFSTKDCKKKCALDSRCVAYSQLFECDLCFIYYPQR